MLRTASKHHQCFCCKGVIAQGEQYERRKVFTGRQCKDRRYHLVCAPAVMATAPKHIDRAHLVALYEQHQNVSYVADILGIAFNTTKFHLKNAGVEIRPAKPRPKEQQAATPWTGLAQQACYSPTISGRVVQQDQP